MPLIWKCWCNRTFLTGGGLDKHIRRDHKGGAQVKDKKKAKCPSCGGTKKVAKGLDNNGRIQYGPCQGIGPH